ncbi:MAG: hypothetical protein HY648_04285 [Acidobacteria bacterium]|nr:hypothetical protein [Acidobacteriota bacterium]
MTDTDYQKVFIESFGKFAVLLQQREEIDAELMKLRQFLNATMNMLPEEVRATYIEQLDTMASQMGGLTEAVRGVLKMATKEGRFLTTMQIRDHLAKAGFDFSRYTSNPLASVNTTLRRFKSADVGTTTIDGVAAYRWIFRFPRTRRGSRKKEKKD